MRRLYEGVILPKMLYTADIWCAGLISKGKGKKSGGRGARSFTSQMARVQRMAALLITGAMHSTPNYLLLAHANLPPFQQTLRMFCHRATLHMATLHKSHPLQKGINGAFNFHANRNFEGSKHHPSPLHKLFNEFKINPTTTETLEPVRHYPKWVPDIEVRIASKPEEAYLEDTVADEDLRVYSDGSAIDRGIGGAAVLMEGDRMVDERRFYLGKTEEHTVYEGEIVGMILVVELLRERTRRRGRARLTMALGVDNQAAIRATGGFQLKPGHYLINMFHDDLRCLLPKNDDQKLIIRWSAGHIGIPGNKAADEQAKCAARGENSENSKLPTSLHNADNTSILLPRSKSAIKQAFHSIITLKSKSIFQTSPRYARFKEIDPSFPSKHFTILAEKLPRRHASLLIQLRTGHIPLNKHFHHISKAPSPLCPSCREREESVHHYLLACPTYTRQRNVMRLKLSPKVHQLKYLLNEDECTKPLFKFIAGTRHLLSTFRDVTPPEREQNQRE